MRRTNPLRAFLKDRRGASAVMMCVAMPILVGGAGLGAEAAFWKFRQRAIQQQADAAAFAGATELRNGGGDNDISGAVNESLTRNGFRTDIGSYDVQSPPVSGAYAGEEAVYVEAEENWPRYFTALFFSDAVTLRANATAEVQEGLQACMLALDGNASAAIDITGSTTVTLNGCSVMSNSSAQNALSIGGSGTLTTSCAGARGGVDADGGMTLTSCPDAKERLRRMEDPYADVPEPVVSGSCVHPSNFAGPSGAVHYASPGRYCGGMNILRTVNFAPGVYIIDGGTLSANSTAVLNGTGVTFFLTNGARLDINGQATLNLSAPTSGTYSGLLFFADRSGSSVNHVLNGTSSSTITGAVYLPNDNLTYSGNNNSVSGCTQIIARTLDLTGNSGIGVNCQGAGVEDMFMPGGVRLVG
jgi:Flp pilus assembly protein TadG